MLIRRAALDDILSALREYQLMAIHEGNAWGQQTARDVMTRLVDHGGRSYVLMPHWYGRNHQLLSVGDLARWWEPGADEFHPCSILEVHTFGAVVEDEFEVDWHSWHSIHRLDRLHTEPDFDVSSWPSIAERMGYDHDPDAEPLGQEPPLYLARRLKVVPGGAQ